MPYPITELETSDMASLVKRNGYYYAQFFDANRTPQRKRISLRTTRKSIARRRLVDWETNYEKEKFDPWRDDPHTHDEDPHEPLSIAEALARFLDLKREQERSENTVRSYNDIIGLLSRTVGPEKKLDRVSDKELDSFIHAGHLAQATRHKRYGHLRTFLRWGLKEHYVRSNPLEQVSKPKKPHKLPKAITAQELETLCSKLREDYRKKLKKCSIAEGQMIWRIPLFWFAFYTGMRASELGRLRWGDIDKDKRLIYIRKQKNGKEQTIPLNAKARSILSEVHESSAHTEPEDYVFASPGFDEVERSARCFRERASRAFREARKLAQLDDSISFHSLRHGFCTMLAEAGKSAVVIKEAARHADIQTSMRYVHMANEKLKEELDDVFE